MNDSRPIIGITFSDRIHTEEEARRIAQGYLEAVEAHGGEARAISPSRPAPAAELDGLLLAGGVDIDPAEFGQPPHPSLGEVEADRDRLELTLAREVAAAGKPIFGICRGAQLLAVLLGGALHQDLAACAPDAEPHRTPEGETLRHLVRVTPGTRLWEIVREEEFEVNSHHHQAISVVGPKLRVAAVAADGVIEAVEGTGEAFVLGVQWHPERLRDDPVRGKLFEAFVEAARLISSARKCRRP